MKKIGNVFENSKFSNFPPKIYEGGYLRNPLNGGVNEVGWLPFLSTEPILMFLDVLENRGHARSFKKTFKQKNIFYIRKLYENFLSWKI